MEDQNVNNGTQYNPQMDYKEQEIDFKAIGLRLWDKKKFILKVFVVFCALGLAAALLQQPKYTATCTFVPQSGSKSSGGSLSSLAAMAGINLGDMSAGQDLSPTIYPQLLKNVDFRKELMRVPLHLKKYDEPVSMYELMTDERYKKVTFSGVLGAVKKYTIGLPFTIIAAIKGKPEDVVVPVEEGKSSPISTYTQDEYKCTKVLDKMVSVIVEKKEGYLTISATHGEDVASAELCKATFDLMDKYVTNFKLMNARKNENYIRDRYEEAKADYEAKQLALARFVDANRGVLTATAQVRHDQLMAEYNMSSSLYTELSKQLLQAEMKVKEDTPVLSPVQGVSVPMQKSNSRAKTLAIWVFMGIIVSCGLVLGFDWLRAQGLNWPKKWE
ncbi:MAG: lipopolysaccharide biosynthesis protein [Bacteroidales bacterium]|nr:lipopolysaccharide biosynthesis protein [Candidatus Cacconaster scatequi]